MSLVETTMALAEDNAVLASRQLDMGNSGLDEYSIGCTMTPSTYSLTDCISIEEGQDENQQGS